MAKARHAASMRLYRCKLARRQRAGRYRRSAIVDLGMLDLSQLTLVGY
jgi:hypothetical protein